jgi:hypothetical protein
MKYEKLPRNAFRIAKNGAVIILNKKEADEIKDWLIEETKPRYYVKEEIVSNDAPMFNYMIRDRETNNELVAEIYKTGFLMPKLRRKSFVNS